MQKESEQRPIFLNSIFERDASGNYTKKALLYQDILEYFFEITKNGCTDAFFFNDLAGWLVTKKNAEFVSYYTDFDSRVSKQNRINARRRRIQECVSNLQNMALILDIGTVKARRNNEKTLLYIYSTNGKIIAWIIRRNKTDVLFGENERIRKEKQYELLKCRKTADEEISKLIQLKFPETEDSDNNIDLGHKRLSEYIFKSTFFKRCKENEIFPSIIDAIRDILLSNSKVKSVSDVFDQVVHQYTTFTNKRLRDKVWNTFIATLYSLDRTQRKIILYREKFDIERRFAKGSKELSREWEELWLQNINEYSKLTLFGICENCKQGYPILVDYYKYKEEAYVLKDKDSMPVLKMDCQKCSAKNKLFVSTWDNNKKDRILT